MHDDPFHPELFEAWGRALAAQEAIAWWRWLAEGGGFDVQACRVLGVWMRTWARLDERQATPRARLAYLAVKTRLWPLAG